MRSWWGNQAEESVRHLAADLGVSDFVFDPLVIQKGNAQRELSDGLLIAGDRGLILQVKAREPAKADDPQRAAAWATKQIDKAVAQVQGTRRYLAQNPGSIVTSRRGYTKTLRMGGDWPGVVILDMPTEPDEFYPTPNDPKTIVMTLVDWRSLHRMLLSTSCVIEYIERVLASSSRVWIGHEAARYFAFAEADARALGPSTSLPALPLDPIKGTDAFYASLVDEWVEEIGLPATGPMPWTDADQQRLAVEVLDALPPLLRVEFGRKLLETIAGTESLGHRKSGIMCVSGKAGSIVFYAANAHNFENLEIELYPELLSLTVVRHEQIARDRHDGGPTLALARVGGVVGGVVRCWALVAGEQPDEQMSADVRWEVVEKFGVLDIKIGLIRNVNRFGRNERCPCQSGRKFKTCCLHKLTK